MVLFGETLTVDAAPVAAVRGTAAKVRASVRPLGAVTSGVAAVYVTLSAIVRASAASSPAETTTPTGEPGAVTTRSGATTPCRLMVVS